MALQVGTMSNADQLNAAVFPKGSIEDLMLPGVIPGMKAR